MSRSRLTPMKIRPDHLDRQALIYSRQSTLLQGREHPGSTTRQYELVPRARDLGWPKERIRVIDQDQGQSGASAVTRDGFQWLVAEVGLKHAGALCCLEASRLARSCSDWYHLLEICALTDTLVIDDEGIYDPGQYNDRLLLGFKGTMSEAELPWLRQRLLGGKLAKAERGQLRFRLPVGLVYDPTGRVVLDPDQEVAEAVRLVLALFEQHGSALAVVTHFAQHHLRFPTRLWGGGHDGELGWGRLTSGRVLSILHNPFYAGAYVYGRTVTRTPVLPGEAPRIKGRTRQSKCDDWPIVLRDVHPGYITWEECRQHQHQLDDNRTWRPEDRRGAVREGAALLQGLVLCGRCGRRRSVRYLHDGRTPLYECNQAHTQDAARTCQTMRGDKIDAAVTLRFLEALQPAHLEVSLATLAHIEARRRQLERQWQLRKERAQYEADVARRRDVAVEPENRLVARSLEREWNEKLAHLTHLEQEYTAWSTQAIPPVSPDERQRILALAQDVPALWHASTTTQTERKHLLRFLVKDVTLTRHEKTLTLSMRWQTGAVTTFDIARLRKSWEVRQTNPHVVTRIRELVRGHTDQQIAACLNAEGLHAGLGGPCTSSKVGWVRWAYDIATGCPERPKVCPSGQRGDGRYSAQKAAELLNVHVSTISAWCKQGRLESSRSAPMSPRWITLTPERLAELRRPTRRPNRRRQTME
jgi:DNA invertase Pin-like site-specific DNA recombinase